MRFLELSFVLGLFALPVEQWTDGIGISSLQAMIGTEMHESAIIVPEILVHSSSEQPLVSLIACRGLELQRTRNRSRRQAGKAAATISGGLPIHGGPGRQQIVRALGPGGIVPEREQTLIERNRGRNRRIARKVGQSGRLILRTRNINPRARRKLYPQALRVDEEECLIFANRPSHRSGP